jgi:hypothetical protein
MEVTAPATLPKEKSASLNPPRRMLFNNTVQLEMLHNDDHKWGVRKEVSMIYLKILPQNFPGET